MRGDIYLEAKGYITHIIYHDEDNSYTVFELETHDGDTLTCTGHFPFINEGEYVQVEGEMTLHRLYDEQLKVISYEITEPDNEVAILRYLSSGAVKGIRGGLAARIVDRFGDRTFDIMEHRPEELALVKGISDKKAREISAAFGEQRQMRSALMFLQKYGVSGSIAVRIYAEYGDELYNIVKTNPYRLAEDISGIGFKKADEIAVKIGFSKDSPGRIRAGLVYLLGIAGGEGHVYLPETVLVREGIRQLEVVEDIVRDVLAVMIMDKVVICVNDGEDRRIYTPRLYYAELNSARMLIDLDIDFGGDDEELLKQIAKQESKIGENLDENQRNAILSAMRRGVSVITGGPGTGKTTTIKTLIKVLMNENLHILMAAPTGRAAKRMEEATGYPAQTIHRLLEFSGAPTDGDTYQRAERFQRNAENPLETDVVIVDEMSMVDIHLFTQLLNAITVTTRLILVGDVNQLPSVGPGNVLKDIIASGHFSVVELTKIFRQAMESDIVVNAHKILAGEQIELKNKKDGDFFFVESTDPSMILNMICESIVRTGNYYGCKPYEVQVLCPMKNGETGVKNCNLVLQRGLNPPSPDKREYKAHDTVFREGDKVMQIKNNYKLAYRIYGAGRVVIEEGQGVFNGDIGVVERVDNEFKEIEVCFDDDKHVIYGSANLDELELAYAVTIHKSQGSEYPVIILPLLGGPRPLMTRNILYTAVTRGQRCVFIIGDEPVIRRMISNESEGKRYSSLCERIRAIALH